MALRWEQTEAARKTLYSEKVTHPVFVYGTMRRGQRNHARLCGARLLKQTHTAGRFHLWSRRTANGYPAPIAIPNGTKHVLGELYLVPGPVLADLDRAEGHPYVYERRHVRIDGHDRVVWMYVFPEQHLGNAVKTNTGIHSVGADKVEFRL